MVGMEVPFYNYETIVSEAKAFCEKYNPTRRCPCPIEEIVEFEFGVDIVPTPGLQKAYEVVAFTTRDLKQIWVDEFVFENRLSRYRFSLAHELAHIVLHPGVLQDASFTTIAEWKEVVHGAVLIL